MQVKGPRETLFILSGLFIPALEEISRRNLLVRIIVADTLVK